MVITSDIPELVDYTYEVTPKYSWFTKVILNATKPEVVVNYDRENVPDLFIERKFVEIINNQQDLPSEINDIVNENFWDLI